MSKYFDELHSIKCIEDHLSLIHTLRSEQKTYLHFASRINEMRDVTVFGKKYDHLFDYVIEVLRSIDGFGVELNLRSLAESNLAMTTILEIEKLYSILRFVLGAFYYYHIENSLEEVSATVCHLDDGRRRYVSKSTFEKLGRPTKTLRYYEFGKMGRMEVLCFRYLNELQQIINDVVYEEFHQFFDFSRGTLPLTPEISGSFIILNHKRPIIEFDPVTKSFTLKETTESMNRDFLPKPRS